MEFRERNEESQRILLRFAAFGIIEELPNRAQRKRVESGAESTCSFQNCLEDRQDLQMLFAAAVSADPPRGFQVSGIPSSRGMHPTLQASSRT